MPHYEIKRNTSAGDLSRYRYILEINCDLRHCQIGVFHVLTFQCEMLFSGAEQTWRKDAMSRTTFGEKNTKSLLT